MAITVLSRWTGNRDDVIRIAGKVKPIVEKHGAEYMRLGQAYAGAFTGQFIVAMRFSGWETYGRAMEAMTSDPEYQAAYAEATAAATIEGRGIITSIEI